MARLCVTLVKSFRWVSDRRCCKSSFNIDKRKLAKSRTCVEAIYVRLGKSSLKTMKHFCCVQKPENERAINMNCNFIKLISIYLDTNVTILRFITAPFTIIIIVWASANVPAFVLKLKNTRSKATEQFMTHFLHFSSSLFILFALAQLGNIAFRFDHRNAIIHTCQSSYSLALRLFQLFFLCDCDCFPFLTQIMSSSVDSFFLLQPAFCVCNERASTVIEGSTRWEEEGKRAFQTFQQLQTSSRAESVRKII